MIMDIRQTWSYKDELEPIIKGNYFVYANIFPTVDNEVVAFSTYDLTAIQVRSNNNETIQCRNLLCRFNILTIDNLLEEIGETAVLVLNIGFPGDILYNGLLVFSNLKVIEIACSGLFTNEGSIFHCPHNALSYNELGNKGGLLSLEEWNSSIDEDDQLGRIVSIKVRSIHPHREVSTIKKFLHHMSSRLKSISDGIDIQWKYMITQSLFDSEISNLVVDGININRVEDRTISLYNAVKFDDVTTEFDGAVDKIMKSASTPLGVDFIIYFVVKDHSVHDINTLVTKLKLCGYLNSVILYTDKLPHNTDLIELDI